ncbi:hypothetical protein ACVITL_006913 [Rhizobium pisi]
MTDAITQEAPAITLVVNRLRDMLASCRGLVAR